jgi:DNA-binding transcriptional MerR regulator
LPQSGDASAMASLTSHDRLLSITELAAELGTTPRAIRFYESKGLLEPQRAGGNRVYTYRDRARLLLILRGKRLGFSLAEVREYLDLYDTDPTQQEQMSHLLRGARRRIAELEEQRRDLELTIDELREIERQVLAAMAQAGIADATTRTAQRPRRSTTP